MVVQKYRLLIFLWLLGCAHTQSPVEITVENPLINCIDIKKSSVVLQKSFPVAEINYKKINMISECGCKSKILSFKSHLQMGDYDSFLISGNFVLQNEDQIGLPIATSREIIGSNPIKISLYCAPPD